VHTVATRAAGSELSQRTARLDERKAETDGEAVVIDTSLAPDDFVAAAHVHPFQSERFESSPARPKSGSAARRVTAER